MTDKLKHIAAGLGIALVIALPVWHETQNLFAGLWGCLAGVIAGGVKEYTDNNTPGNQWNWVELLMTVVGGVLVALFIVLLHYGKG